MSEALDNAIVLKDNLFRNLRGLIVARRRPKLAAAT